MFLREKPASAIPLALLSALLTSWALAVLVAGRAIPWQADREWALLFVATFLVAGPRWWRYWVDVSRRSGHAGRLRVAVAWGAAPSVIAGVLFLGAAYLSDGFYGFLRLPFYRMQLLAGAAAAALLLESLLFASVIWLRGDNVTLISALQTAVAERRRAVLWGSLLTVGALQGASMSSPINDDIAKYFQAAVAMLNGAPYPVHIAGAYLVHAGMTADSPALPGLSVLLALSFAFLGQNYFGLAVPLAALAAVFPLVLYWACISFTGSELISYSAAILLTLFPAYQIHVLGTAVPDTLFVVALLLTAAAAARAIETMKWQFWIGVGLGAGLAANSRPEGIDFALGILAILFVFHLRSWHYWLAVLTCLLALSPFALTYRSVEGTIWPATFGGTVSPQHVEPNLANLRDLVLPWYEQAIGLGAPALAALGVLIALGGLVALLGLWRERPGLIFVPLLGYGYLAASLMIHPLILVSYTPVDVLRHWSSGIPYIAVSLAYSVRLLVTRVASRLSRPAWMSALLILVAVVAWVTYYECERLARPEWYFGGSASLLWTGNAYLLTDLARNPLPLPPASTVRPWEQVRKEQIAELAPISLRTTNASEPYDWTALIIALFGLAYASVPPPGRATAALERPAPRAIAVSG